VVAWVHEKKLVANPKSMTVFEAGDRIGLIGDAGQIESARKLV
jgi:monovalent cation:H+ antiporter-2, CPA2 family